MKTFVEYLMEVSDLSNDEKEAFIHFIDNGKDRGYKLFASGKLAKQWLKSKEAQDYRDRGFKLQLKFE